MQEIGSVSGPWGVIVTTTYDLLPVPRRHVPQTEEDREHRDRKERWANRCYDQDGLNATTHKIRNVPQ